MSERKHTTSRIKTLVEKVRGGNFCAASPAKAAKIGFVEFR
jgi:hypothetical protein